LKYPVTPFFGLREKHVVLSRQNKTKSKKHFWGKGEGENVSSHENIRKDKRSEITDAEEREVLGDKTCRQLLLNCSEKRR
jgi:hypothetical protein